MDEWRSILYPLGFLSTVVFGARFIVQWIQSELSKKSVVPPIFWQLSILGNCLLTLHSFIQIQFHICLIQSWNIVISWRNLNLMGPEYKHSSLKCVLKLLALTSFIIIGAFIAQHVLFDHEGHWFRVPIAPWKTASNEEIPFAWHILGTFSYLLFSSRFWIQWWMTEKAQKSVLPRSFWMISLVGALFSILYFYRIDDTVNMIGPILGLVPYLRNLMLIQHSERVTQQ